MKIFQCLPFPEVASQKEKHVGTKLKTAAFLRFPIPSMREDLQNQVHDSSIQVVLNERSSFSLEGFLHHREFPRDSLRFGIKKGPWVRNGRFDRFRADVGRFWPSPANFGPKSGVAEFGKSLADSGPILVDVGPNLVHPGPCLVGKIRTTWGGGAVVILNVDSAR